MDFSFSASSGKSYWSNSEKAYKYIENTGFYWGFKLQKEDKSRSFIDWRPSNRGDTIGWGVAFFWAGLILLAQTINFSSNFSWWDGWAIFFTGAGLIALIGVVIRLLVPKYPGPSIWDVIWSFFLLFIGLSRRDAGLNLNFDKGTLDENRKYKPRF